MTNHSCQDLPLCPFYPSRLPASLRTSFQDHLWTDIPTKATSNSNLFSPLTFQSTQFAHLATENVATHQPVLPPVLGKKLSHTVELLPEFKQVPTMLRKGSCCIPSPVPSRLLFQPLGDSDLLSLQRAHTPSVSCTCAVLAPFFSF